MKKTGEIFVDNLRRLRKEKFSAAKDFAEKVNLSDRGYQRYEEGDSQPTPDILDRFAKVLGCKPWELLMPYGLPGDLTADQSRILDAFRDVDPAMVDQIIKIVDLTVGLKQGKDRRRGKA